MPGTIYFDTGGSAANSGTTDTPAATWSGSAATVSGSTVTLDGSPDLSALATNGSQAIYLAQATNSNQKIFWITGKDDTAKTVTVSVAPTGVTSSGWAIGGQMVYTSANFESAVRAGDTLIFNNSPASKSGSAFLTARVSGNLTDGWITVQGKVGTRPVLNITDTNNVLAGSAARWKVERLELDQDGASGDVVNMTGNDLVFLDVKISDGGGQGLSFGGLARLQNCEVSGVSSTGLRAVSSGNSYCAIGCYVHDVGGAGFLNATGGGGSLLFCIFDTCVLTGCQVVTPSGTAGRLLLLVNNTIYGCANSGIEAADGDISHFWYNNIVKDNGNAAGEYNIEFAAESDAIATIHDYNCLHTSGGGGSGNYAGFTPNTNDIVTDPLFVDAPNGDFRLLPSSPCRGAGFPGQFLGGPRGYLSMGAVQPYPFVAPVFGGAVLQARA